MTETPLGTQDTLDIVMVKNRNFAVKLTGVHTQVVTF